MYLLRPSKRVFILGPSHHVYLDGCALSKCTEYATPLGSLPLDRPSMLLFLGVSSESYESFAAIEELKKTGKFSEMELSTDEDEHSIEMHLPYVRKIFEGYVRHSVLLLDAHKSYETTQSHHQERNIHRPSPSRSHRQGERGGVRTHSRAVPRERRHILRHF